MTQPKFPVMTPVVCSWEDAASSGGGNDTYDSPQSAVKAFRPVIRKTMGYFVGYASHGGRSCLLLCCDDDRTPESPEAVGGVNQIPVGMIVDIVPVCPPKKTK